MTVPTPVEKIFLAMICWRESRGNYVARNPKPGSTASGGFQFINSTWKMACLATGVGTAYSSAYLAPPGDQQINALWLLRKYGANSPQSWQASGPYPSVAEVSYVVACLT